MYKDALAENTCKITGQRLQSQVHMFLYFVPFITVLSRVERWSSSTDHHNQFRVYYSLFCLRKKLPKRISKN